MTDPRTEDQKKFDEDFQKRYTENAAIVMKIDETIDPFDTEKTKQYQRYLNRYVHNDDVLAIDGEWGNKTQEAHLKYKRMRRYSGSMYTPTNWNMASNVYEINTSNRTDEEKKVAIDSLYTRK